MCSCGEEVIVYYCTHTQCVFNLTDPIYCQACLVNGKHPHYPHVMILDYLSEVDKQWAKLKEEFNIVSTAATDRYKENEPLINYFEHEMMIVSFALQPQLI